MSDDKGIQVADSVSFASIRYASVWEDADILCQALKPVAAGGRLLSIASSGDNVLAMLTLDPSEVVAADLSSAQLACLDLRMAAFSRLEYPELTAFLGVNRSSSRLATYQELRDLLQDSSRRFWDHNTAHINSGIIHQGKFERYLRAFGTRALPLIQGRSRCQELIEKKSIQEQATYYSSRWDTSRWRGLFRIFFSRLVMGRAGRDPEFFSQVEGTVAQRVLKRVKHGLKNVPNWSNPYLVYIMTGNYREDALPLYLRKEAYETIRRNIGRVRLFKGQIQNASEGNFDGANLSDLFEYLSEGEFEQVYGTLLERMNPNARLAYWNMLVPRYCPERFTDKVEPRDEEADILLGQDKAWFYQRFRLERVK